jgi:hypothetical protein
MTKKYEITNEQRVKLLQGFNHLGDMLRNVEEMNDLYLSDIRNLQVLQCSLHMILDFKPKFDEDGHSLYYADWVMKDDDADKPKSKKGAK